MAATINWHIEKRAVAELKPHPQNERIFTEAGLRNLNRSISSIGMAQPVNITQDGIILSGHARIMTLQQMGITEVEVYVPDRELSEKEQQEILVRMNANNAGIFDTKKLEEYFSKELLADWGMDNLDHIFAPEATADEIDELKSHFAQPVQSLLDTKAGEWQDRKRIWKKLIQEKGESREGTLSLPKLQKGANGKQEQAKGTESGSVSILDPVLCEVVLDWFGPKTDGPKYAFDAFAGDTVFGYVSSFLGYNFTGIELRPEQVEINNERTKDFTAHYICDDGQNVANHLEPESQDIFFSCPPYFNLEVYSDDPKDASNQSYAGFIDILDHAFTGAVKCLKKDRFAVVVMSNVRDDDGAYHDICGDITRIFEKAGCVLWNEIILLNVAGTAPMRARNGMKNRKVCRVHQEVLVYYKGDTNNIKDLGD